MLGVLSVGCRPKRMLGQSKGSMESWLAVQSFSFLVSFWVGTQMTHTHCATDACHLTGCIQASAMHSCCKDRGCLVAWSARTSYSCTTSTHSSTHPQRPKDPKTQAHNSTATQYYKHSLAPHSTALNTQTDKKAVFDMQQIGALIEETRVS